MIFRTFEDELVIALHQPKGGQNERARFYRLIEEHEDIKLGDKLFNNLDENKNQTL